MTDLGAPGDYAVDLIDRAIFAPVGPARPLPHCQRYCAAAPLAPQPAADVDLQAGPAENCISDVQAYAACSHLGECVI